jgi:hypothetical protein
VTNHYERLKMQRRMQRRIRLVVEERRIAFADPATGSREPLIDAESTIEIPPSALRPVPVRAIGRVAIRPA